MRLILAGLNGDTQVHVQQLLRRREYYLGQLLDEVVSVGLLARPLDLLLGDAIPAEADILVDGAAEQNRLLTDNSDSEMFLSSYRWLLVHSISLT